MLGDLKVVDNPLVPVGHYLLDAGADLVWLTPKGDIHTIPRRLRIFDPMTLPPFNYKEPTWRPSLK